MQYNEGTVPKYTVTALNRERETYREVLDALDRFAVYRSIRERGDHIVSIDEEKKKGFFSFSFSVTLNGISGDEKVIVIRNLGAMLEAGLTTSRALSVLERQSKKRRLKEVLKSLVSEVERGSPLSIALSKFADVFSPLLISMVRAGEESGKLSESLRVVAVQMEKANTLKKKIRGAMMYPSIVLAAMVVIGILMLIYVVPTLTQTFNELGGELPPTTKFVISLSQFFSGHPLTSLGLIIAAVVGVVVFAKTPRGRMTIDFIMLRVPLIRGLVAETNAARTTRTLSSLLSSGVDMVLAVSITREVVQNVFYQKVLHEAEKEVVGGGALSATFSRYPNLYPPLVSEMVAVGEETGRLSFLLKETAEFYENSVEQQTKDLSTIIEPFLMLIIGAAVGFFALSMIAPIYSLSNAI